MSSKAPNPLKIIFFSMDAAGHLYACVGMAQALVKRGHVVKFLVSDSFAGQYAKYGFEEVLLKRHPNGQSPVEKVSVKNPFKDIAEQVQKSGFVNSAKSPLDKLKDHVTTSGPPAFIIEMIDSLIAFDPQIDEALKQEVPDVTILDHFFVPPALPRSGIPWMYLSSGNPLGLYQSEVLPPGGSGYATDSDPASWAEYRELSKNKKGFFVFQKRLNDAVNYSPTAEEVDRQQVGFSGKSTVLNIYGYPEELDYQDIVPIPDKFARVDAFCLESPHEFKLPEHFVVKPGVDKLVYVSLGSMASVDVNLMKRITQVLVQSPHKFIVSKGPHAEKYELPENCWGEAFLPQTRILPLVDLVITHGGNNTVTEAFTFGKPMIVMPLMGDQYDNAQRITEKRYGTRLETNGFTDEELLGAIDRLLNDKDLIQRAKNAADRIKHSNSKEVVCKKIEQVVSDLKNRV